MSGMKTLFGLSMLIFGLTFAGYAVADSSGLTKIDVKTGTGKEAISGKMVRVHYTDWAGHERLESRRAGHKSR